MSTEYFTGGWVSKIEKTGTVEVRCTECNFTQSIHPEDDKIPAEIVVKHGKSTGHKLSVNELTE